MDGWMGWRGLGRRIGPPHRAYRVRLASVWCCNIEILLLTLLKSLPVPQPSVGAFCILRDIPFFYPLSYNFTSTIYLCFLKISDATLALTKGRTHGMLRSNKSRFLQIRYVDPGFFFFFFIMEFRSFGRIHTAAKTEKGSMKKFFRFLLCSHCESLV